MKVGDYVRSDRGIIAKITNINKTGSIICDRNIYFGFNVVSNKRVLCDLSKIIKSSPNIIDLIEEGDYVNGHRVNFIDGDREYFVISFGDDAYTLKSQFNDDIYWLSKEDIKSIVTKEQFEAMKYEIK